MSWKTYPINTVAGYKAKTTCSKSCCTGTENLARTEPTMIKFRWQTYEFVLCTQGFICNKMVLK